MNSDDENRTWTKCIRASKTLYAMLQREPRLNSLVFEPHSGLFCFRVKFPNPIGEVHAISISYPLDTNRCDDPQLTIETALINEEGDLCYVKELGYYNVCSFDSGGEIVEEILRISSANP